MNYGTSPAMDHSPNHIPIARIVPRAEFALFGHALPKRPGPDQNPAALITGESLDGGIGGLGIEQEVIALKPANESALRLPFFLLDLAGKISTATPAPIRDATVPFDIPGSRRHEDELESTFLR